MLVARAATETFHPMTLNYAIHGNTIAHLHLHLFPRFAGDAFDGRAIEPRETPRHETTAGQVTELVRSIERLRGTV